MTAEERAAIASGVIWYWLPARWTNGISWFEIRGYAVTEIGVDVRVSKDDGDIALVSFADSEIDGAGRLDPTVARARIEAV